MINKLKEKDSDKLSKQEVYMFLISYLEEQISLSQRSAMNEDSFSKPSWSEYQAYQLGMQKAFSKVKEIIPDQGKIKHV